LRLAASNRSKGNWPARKLRRARQSVTGEEMVLPDLILQRYTS
jgi:hypothetical protein